MSAASTDSGIDRNTAIVARKLPRNTSTISAVSARPMPPSCSSVSIARFTNSDWSNTTSRPSSFGTSTSRPIVSLMPSTTAIVFVSPPCFITGR